jgi:hypothetical protein
MMPCQLGPVVSESKDERSSCTLVFRDAGRSVLLPPGG